MLNVAIGACPSWPQATPPCTLSPEGRGDKLLLQYTGEDWDSVASGHDGGQTLEPLSFI